jgi:hypothetical protein
MSGVKIKDLEWVLASDFDQLLNRRAPSTWNLYPSEAAALAAREQNAPALDHYKPMPYRDYERWKIDFWLDPESNKLKAITKEAYWNALECLPPVEWEHRDGVESFCMMEFMDASITHQYAKLGDRHFCRLVNFTDKATWITAAECQQLIAAMEPQPQA